MKTVAAVGEQVESRDSSSNGKERGVLGAVIRVSRIGRRDISEILRQGIKPPLANSYAGTGDAVPCLRSSGLGMRTADMPAAIAPSIPIGASSNTRHFSGETPSRNAPARKTSGAGFEHS